MKEVAAWVANASRVAFLTGAGISTESGIPDFRGPNGVWTKNPEAEKMSDISWYMNHREIRVKSWAARLVHPVWNARANGGHEAITALERLGRMHSLATQNIDGLHQLAGSSPDLVIELHGTMREVMCMSCGDRLPMEQALDRVRAGEDDPPCAKCRGILKSATVSFGQSLDPDVIERAHDDASNCDVYFAVGTSLGVYPAAALPEVALTNGARLVIVNEQPTPYDGLAHAVLRDKASSVLSDLVNEL
ncbi:MAG: Sir2 family NAD-dependent protein deacetylase [Actinomycetota bacterium]